MSRTQLFPLSSTRESFHRLSSQTSFGQPPDRSKSVTFLRSPSLNNSATPSNFVSGRSSRNKAIGLALAFGVGIGFWTGIVLMVARVWR
jgi:hypothetical protein